MGELMGTLLLIVDTWYELAKEAAAERFAPSDRVEVLGLLVRFLARRFSGFRLVPRPDDVRPVIKPGSVGLHIRCRIPPPVKTEEIERQLAEYGFVARLVPGSDGRELVLSCHNLTGAQILAFPDHASAMALRSRRHR
jgi:hypothetical protein